MSKLRSFRNYINIISLCIILIVTLIIVMYIHQRQVDRNQAAGTSQIYWGATIADIDGINGFAPWSTSVIDVFEADAGKKISILQYGQPWYASSGPNNFPASIFDTVRNRGEIPHFSWESDLSSNYSGDQSAYKLQNIINGNFDSYIRQWATDAKNWGHPFFLRFDWEMNGNWYPWSEQTNGNSAGKYVATWRHVHDIFTSVGATNVTWVWDINTEGSGLTSISELYPGSSYVDWVGIDGYNWGGTSGHIWQSFSSVFQQTYNDVLSLAPGKPIIISETASDETGGSKASWITDMLSTQLPNNFPQVKAVLWFNWQDGNHPWPIESSSTSKSAFASGIASSYYATNSFGSLSQSPIQPLSGGVTNTPIPPTPTPHPTNTPTPTPIPTSTPVPVNTILSLPTLLLHGIGNGGDSVNPTSSGNMNPLTPQRTLTVEVYNASNQLVTTQTGTVTYSPSTGAFSGSINLGQLPTGPYLVKIKTDKYLKKQLAGIISLTQGQTTVTPTTSLIAGDINGDNTLNILDYNILLGCYSDFLPPTNCPGNSKAESDLTDDGNVNASDYNLFLRELSVQTGQ